MPRIPTCKTSLFFPGSQNLSRNWWTDPKLGGTSVPYNQIFDFERANRACGVDHIRVGPKARIRLGNHLEGATVQWSVGGFGIFMTTFPGQVVDSISENPPLFQSFTVGSGANGEGTTNPALLISPAEKNNLFSAAAASNNAFLSGFHKRRDGSRAGN